MRRGIQRRKGDPENRKECKISLHEACRTMCTKEDSRNLELSRPGDIRLSMEGNHQTHNLVPLTCGILSMRSDLKNRTKDHERQFRKECD